MDKNCWESSPPIQRKKREKCAKLSAQVYYRKSYINLCLEAEGLTWSENDKSNVVYYHEIINVKRSKANPDICVNYIAKSADKNLEFKKLKIKFESCNISEIWSKSISKQIKKFSRRIKKLVFIIDKIPLRCKVDGEALFQEYMMDIIHELRLTYVIKNISSPNDIDDLEQISEVIKSCDGIVILSGDESASSIISKIINMFQIDDCVVKQVSVPFNIIPIGFHNDISRSIWKSENAQNIFLSTFLNNTFPSDVLSITKNESIEKRWGFNCHYGYYTIQEKYRLANNDMKESLLKKKSFKKLRSFDCIIQYKSSPSSKGQPTDDTVCHENCPSCNSMTMSVTNTPIYKLDSSTKSALTDSENSETIKHIYGTSWIVVNCIPCRNEIAEKGFAPSCHFNDGAADVILVKSTNINDMKKYLKYQKFEGTQLQLSFVDSIRVEDIHINVKASSSWTNCDLNSNLEMKVSKCYKSNIVTIEDDDDDDSSSSVQGEMIKQEDSTCSKITESTKNKNKIRKLLRPLTKACKELSKSTQASQGTDKYKKPNMLESDKERERKEEKQKRKKIESNKFETSWMLDYSILEDMNSTINIKVHSGLISFFGDAMKQDTSL